MKKNIESIIKTCFWVITFAFWGYFVGNIQVDAKEKEIYINEVCAKNTIIADELGNYYDWVELYNPGENDVDISGYYLSDDIDDNMKWVFPDGTIVLSHDYIIVYCDKKAGKTNHNIADFGLSTDEDVILLSNTYGEIIDEIQIKNLSQNISCGRLKDDMAIYRFDTMSPMYENKLEFTLAIIPSFSVDSGFYSDEFELTLYSDDDSIIYYTLDGSIPTIYSNKYVEPILVKDCTGQKNVLSSYTAISANEVTKYIAPSYNVDKAFVIRAISVNTAGKISNVSTATYFVGDMKEKYENNLVVSIVTDYDNLFSDDKGIYVLGDTFTNWKNSEEYDSKLSHYQVPANYQNKGKEWERQASIQFLEENKQPYSIDAGIRIHGGATRACFQKSFSLYARSEYGSSKFDYDFYNKENKAYNSNNKVIEKYDSIMLRNTGNDYSQLRFRDKLNQKLIEDRNLLTQAQVPAIVFINGEYWGQYEITEKISDYYIYSHFGVKEEDVCIIKNGELEEGSENGLLEWKELYSWIRNTDFSLMSNYEALKEKIDISSFIDYVSSEIYISNSDWGANNVAFWKSEKIDESNEFADGKWRFLVFDTEFSTNYNSNNKYTKDDFHNLLTEYKLIYNIFQKLIQNSEFKEEFIVTFLDIANSNFKSDRVISLINLLGNEYEKYALDYYRRFHSETMLSSEKYKLYLKSLSNFYLNRFDYITSFMKSDFDLKGELVNVSLEYDDHVDSITLNTVDSCKNLKCSWNGYYFTDYPIHISTKVDTGYTFLHYEVSDDNGIRIYYDIDTDIILDGNTVVKVICLADAEAAVLGKPYTMGEEGLEYDVNVPHIIINQIYGGKKKESYASHSFIELYNQTDEAVDLTGWSLQYRSSIDGGDNAAWSKLDLSGIIPSHCSYLVRCKKIKDPIEGSVVIDNYDLEWDQVINNKGCSVVLVANNKLIPADSAVFDNEIGKPAIYDYVDMVGVSGNDTDNEENIANEAALFYEGEASPIQSKKNGIRREKLKDTDNNAEKEDFIAVDYSFGNADYIAYISPKCVADGAWEYNKNNVPRYTVTFVEHDDVTSQKKFKYNTKVDIPDDPEREGYTFAGWFEDEECTTSYKFKNKPVSDITLYAGWTPIDYTITYYNVDGADNSNPISYTIEDADIILANPVKEGSVFYGWYTDAEYTGEAITIITTSDIENIELYARWKVIITHELAIDGWTYGESANDPVVSGPVSGAAISFEYKTKGSDDSTYSESVPILAGDYTVKATLSETEEYVFNEATADFTIHAKTVTEPAIVLSSVSFVYDGSEKTPGVTVMDGSTVIDPNEYNVNISNNTAAGIATVTITDKDGGNYIVSGSKEFTISKAVPAILIAPEAGALVYGQSLADSAVTGGAVSVAGTFAWDNAEIIPSVANSGVTEYSVVFTPADTDNYDTVKFGVKVSVAKAEPQYTVPTGITAVYGDALADVELPDGWAWADGSVSVGDVGVHSFAAIYTPVDTVNYNNAEAQIEVSVGKDAPVLTVPVAMANLTYTGTAQELVSVSAVSGGAISFAVVYNVSDDLAGVPGEDAFSDAVPTGVSAGTYTVWYKVTGDGNHLDTEPASLDVVIGRASAVVYADNGSKAYGEADPVLSATVSGLKGSDTKDVLSYSLFRSAGESVDTYNIIAMGDEVQGNYNVSYVQGAFTIETKAVTDPVIVLSQDSFVYDGTAKTPSVTVRVGNTTIDPSEYTVTYSNNIEAGTATVTITDNVGGSFEISGNATFTITELETENQGEGENQSGNEQGEGKGQDDNQSGTEQGEGQGQGESLSGDDQGEGQGQDDTQSGTDQGEGQGETQSGTEQGNDQNQSSAEQGSQQSSTDNGNSGYAPVIVPSDNTSVVVNDLSNTGSKDSSSNNGTDGKDTEKDTDKVNDIPSVSESVKDVIEIATSELFESITELMTGSAKGTDVIVELKVSKTKLTVKKGKTSKIKPKLVTKSADGTVQTVSDVSKFRFISLNPSVAKVSKKGMVTGTSNGSCTIYVIAENGMVKQIRITVK